MEIANFCFFTFICEVNAENGIEMLMADARYDKEEGRVILVCCECLLLFMHTCACIHVQTRTVSHRAGFLCPQEIIALQPSVGNSLRIIFLLTPVKEDIVSRYIMNSETHTNNYFLLMTWWTWWL